MTPELLDWAKRLHLKVDNVLEIGAYNINGTMRDVIQHNHWLGTDMRPGPCVDMVVDGAQLADHFGSTFDLVVCAEVLEHCEDWRTVLSAAWHCIKQKGWLMLTVPGPDFPKHDFPSDYQRFDEKILRTIFRDHNVRNFTTIKYPHTGLALMVEKSGPDIEVASVEALPVP